MYIYIYIYIYYMGTTVDYFIASHPKQGDFGVARFQAVIHISIIHGEVAVRALQSAPIQKLYEIISFSVW